jgi:co-chaperonin GroES (HSP10)
MFRPILDRVLVRRSAPPQDSTIVTPDAYQQQSNEGVVVAIGDFVAIGGQTFPLSQFIRVGDRVRFGEYNAETFDEKERLVLVRIQDIRGVEQVWSESSATSVLTTTASVSST